MERLTHDADFGLEDWEETLFFVKSDPNGAYNILDIARFQGEAEFDEILKNIALRLAAYEDTGLAPEEIQIQKEAMERMGWFGKMFQRYKGDPRGPIGTLGNAWGKFLVESCIEPARNRQAIKDVDGNTWLPMLLDEFESMADVIEHGQEWIPVKVRLPDKPGHYLVCTNVNYWHGGCMDKNGSSSNAGTTDGYAGTTLSVLDCFYDITGDWNRVCNAHVTHWMPLPQPPKEEKKND